jgi:hypothetical protein
MSPATTMTDRIRYAASGTVACGSIAITLLGVWCAVAAAQPETATGSGPAASGAGDTTEVQGAMIGRYGEPVGVDPETFRFSEAEKKLWLGDHLANIGTPARLHYQFEKSGSFEEGFADSVYLDVLELNPDGTRNADMQFFTGDREQPFTPDNVTGITGNPVLGLYMRGDVHDMERLTNGSWRYFQRSVKLAFADAARVEPIEIEFGGRKLAAERISITPYAEDPRLRQFEHFNEKQYEFILSEQVPGTLYSIRTVIPGDAAEPLIVETLTLQDVKYRK